MMSDRTTRSWSNLEGAPVSGPYPLAKALDYAIQIAEALDAAWRPMEGFECGETTPRWRPDTKELFYINAEGLLTAVPIGGCDGELNPGTPVTLFETGLSPSGNSFLPFDATADGRFLITIPWAAYARCPWCSSPTGFAGDPVRQLTER